MKKIIFLTALFISGCSIKTIPLKGTYPDKPFQVVSDKTRDQVWDKLVDMFAQNGISIKIIDKSSGLIVANATQLSWAYEDKNGNLVSARVKSQMVTYKPNPNASVVIPKRIFDGIPLAPSYVTGDWNVRIKEENGKTVINVNLVNIKEIGVESDYHGTHSTETISSGRTTGNFEKTIAAIIG